MKITELEWLKKEENKNMLSQSDKKKLEELGVFKLMEEGELALPTKEMLVLMEQLANIVEKYTMVNSRKTINTYNERKEVDFIVINKKEKECKIYYTDKTFDVLKDVDIMESEED